ncbi:hypothetical protein TW65_09237 [Stemphylium lycopersici]|nr:hypothetical protein TW65_09237 [Stemphylium lycopersici]
MGRKKRQPHRSPDSLADAFRDIPLHQLAKVRKSNTEENRKALLNSLVPEEMLIPTDWLKEKKTEKRIEEKIEEKTEDARHLQRKRDLLEVLRIITTRFQGGLVTPEEFEWALYTCKEEQELEDKELAEILTAMKYNEQAAHSNTTTGPETPGSETEVRIEDSRL